MILEQLRRYNEKMQDIQELEYAENQAVNQLRLKRQNTVRRGPPVVNYITAKYDIAFLLCFKNQNTTPPNL